jgi:hypothetical protein
VLTSVVGGVGGEALLIGAERVGAEEDGDLEFEAGIGGTGAERLDGVEQVPVWGVGVRLWGSITEKVSARGWQPALRMSPYPSAVMEPSLHHAQPRSSCQHHGRIRSSCGCASGWDSRGWSPGS